MALIETPATVFRPGMTEVLKVTSDPVRNITGKTFKLTLRADPDYKALLAGQRHLKDPDPATVAASWAVILTTTEVVVYDATNGVFGMVARKANWLATDQFGTQRGIYDIVDTTDAANPWPVIGPRWADIVSPAYPLT